MRKTLLGINKDLSAPARRWCLDRTGASWYPPPSGRGPAASRACGGGVGCGAGFSREIFTAVANGIQRLPKIRHRTRTILIATADSGLIALSFACALLLRFDREDVAQFQDHLPEIVLLLVGCRLAWNLFFKLHLWSYRYSGLADGARIGMAGVSGTALFVLVVYFLMPAVLPELGRAVLVLELLLSTSSMVLIRFGPRLALTYHADLFRGRRPEAVPAIIVGAGSAGEMLLRALHRSRSHDYRVVGFVDDEPSKQGHVVGGKSVLGDVADLPGLVDRHGIREVLIAIPRLPASRVRDILELGTHLKLGFKILPWSVRDLHEQSATAQLRDLTPRDLLLREEVAFKHGREASFLAGGAQLIAGAAGSIGSEVCVQLLAAGARRLVMLDIDENGLYLLKRRLDRRFPDRVVVPEVADIRDVVRLEAVFSQHRPVDVFHAAARKQVPLMESAPGEAVKTNVLGTLNLARVAADSGAERFVFMSTDKAVQPVSVMGASKRLGEMLMRRLGETLQTRFSAVRFGNVLDSAGSVVPLFREQIEAGGPVTVTHPEARRYFMTISEAVGMALRAAYGDYGRLCVLEMGEPIQISHLARLMITMSGRAPDVDVKISYVGLRPGEKLDEELIAPGERVVRRIDAKISVVDGPAPAENLLLEIEKLRGATAAEDHEAVLGWLRRLVPDYRPLLPASDSSGVLLGVDVDAPVM